LVTAVFLIAAFVAALVELTREIRVSMTNMNLE
jgi:hypothetical protein